MKKLNLDVVQVMSLAGSVLTLAAGILTSAANERKLERKIDERVAEALAKQVIDNTQSNE